MGGSGSGGGFLPPEPRSPCAALTFATQLASPQRKVVQKLEVGDDLEIQLVTEPAPAAAAYLEGALAGTIGGPRAPRLVECLEAGFSFIATVTAIHGGRIDVTVSAQQ